MLYMTDMDPTAYDLKRNPHGSITITEASLSYPNNVCDQEDVQDPQCAKITLSGTFSLADESELDTALTALYFRHPSMANWPAWHGFEVWKLNVETIFFLDYYGGANPITVDEYLAAEVVL